MGGLNLSKEWMEGGMMGRWRGGSGRRGRRRELWLLCKVKKKDKKKNVYMVYGDGIVLNQNWDSCQE